MIRAGIGNVSHPQAQARPQPKVFHATMLVTRAEEWWVEADTVEEARALFDAGLGHHSSLGERVHVELEELFEDQ